MIINVEVGHVTQRQEQWIYVYDKDKYSVRINFTELLSPNNAPRNKSGIQIEVYFSKEYKPRKESFEYYSNKVVEELIEMKLILDKSYVENVHTRWIQHANVVFDHKCKNALNKVLDWLKQYGLKREEDDLNPITDWGNKFSTKNKLGDLILAGRFGQWKYFWTDDCVLRGKFISENLV